LCLKAFQRLTHRRPADPKALGQFGLDQPRPARQRAAIDRIEDQLIDITR
jgi:hypothetical protein